MQVDVGFHLLVVVFVDLSFVVFGFLKQLLGLLKQVSLAGEVCSGRSVGPVI